MEQSMGVMLGALYEPARQGLMREVRRINPTPRVHTARLHAPYSRGGFRRAFSGLSGGTHGPLGVPLKHLTSTNTEL